MLDGSYDSLFPFSFPQTLGCDVVGTVVRDDAGRFSPGDLVWGEVGVGATEGAWASYVSAPSEVWGLAPSLAASDASACATLPLVGKTMYQALELASELLTPANKAANRSCVVVSSGTGGTGTVGVQLAKALGASYVISTAGGASAVELVRSLGADRVIDYESADLLEQLEPASVDVFIDNFGYDADRAVSRVRPGGVYVSLTHTSPSMTPPDVTVTQLTADYARHDDLDRLAALVESGQVRPVVQAVFDMHDAVAAMRQMQTKGVTGKIALSGFA